MLNVGTVWKAVANLLPQDKLFIFNVSERWHDLEGCGRPATPGKLRFNQHVVNIDKEAKTVEMADGKKIKYNSLLSTMPLDLTCRWLGKSEWADGLQHSSSHIVGVGIRGLSPHGSKCWLYYPEGDCPYYRCTVFSNYSQTNCPQAGSKLPTLCMGDATPAPDSDAKDGPYWSLMFEISESQYKPVNQEDCQLGGKTWSTVVKDTLLGAISTQLMTADCEVVSLYHRRLEHGYPTPSLGRDEVLAEALPWLQQQGIWSRGRFGSYKYEVANQDHSMMLGVEAADNILFGTKELTLAHPDIVNAKKNTELVYTKK
eukprot:gene18103-24534_t